MVYHINSFLLCATILGTICFLIESIAYVHDIKFTQNINHGDIFGTDKNCSFIALGYSEEELKNDEIKADSRDIQLLRRDLPFQALFVLLSGFNLILNVVNIVITFKLGMNTRVTRGKLVQIMNKLVSWLASALFSTSATLLILSVVFYDLRYIQFNNGRPMGCNFGYQHENKLDSYCDTKYGICQKKTLKLTASAMSLICMTLGICGVKKEMTDQISNSGILSRITLNDKELIKTPNVSKFIENVE